MPSTLLQGPIRPLNAHGAMTLSETTTVDCITRSAARPDTSQPCSRSAHESARYDQHFLQAVRQGLAGSPKRLPCKYFYDQRGSELFEQICELPEYYPMRCETQIMQDHIGSMVDAIERRRRPGSSLRLVELGSGSSVKTRWLLESLACPLTYIPIDISADHLMSVASGLRDDFPGCRIEPMAADFTTPLVLPEADDETTSATVAYFPGSTIGNFQPEQAKTLLRQIGELIPRHNNGMLLVGFDLDKDRDVLRAAYDDSRGITARFNLNLLRRINLELGGDFALSQFEHQARYNESLHRIEMHLVSQVAQQVHVGEETFSFAAGESVHTENSHKYSRQRFEALAATAGWSPRGTWTDRQGYFAVTLFEL